MVKKLKQTDLSPGDVVSIDPEYLKHSAVDLKGRPLGLNMIPREVNDELLMVVVKVLPLELESLTTQLVTIEEVSINAIRRVVANVYQIISGYDCGLSNSQKYTYQSKVGNMRGYLSRLPLTIFPLVGSFVSLPEVKFEKLKKKITREYVGVRNDIAQRVKSFIPDYDVSNNVFLVVARGPELLTLVHVTEFMNHRRKNDTDLPGLRVRCYNGSVSTLLEINNSSDTVMKNTLRACFKNVSKETTEMFVGISKSLFNAKREELK